MILLYLLRKELKEQLTLRIVIMVSVISLVFLYVSSTVDSVDKIQASEIPLLIIDEDGSAVSGTMHQVFGKMADVRVLDSSTEDLQQVLEEFDTPCYLVIPEGFGTSLLNAEPTTWEIHWVLRESGILTPIRLGIYENMLTFVADELNNQFLIAGASPSYPEITRYPILGRRDVSHYKGRILEDVSGKEVVGSPLSRSNLMSMFIVIMMIISGMTIISSMGLEKGNKTLEMLLTMPLKREYIVVSKIMASAITGFVMASIYMIGYYFYMKTFSFGTDVLEARGIVLSSGDFVLVGLSMFLAIFDGILLCFFMSLHAKDYESAQPFLFPVLGLSIFSLFLTTFTGYGALSGVLRSLLFAIPFSHPMLAENFLLAGRYGFVSAGIGYMVLFAAVMVILIIRIFNSDKVLTNNS